MCKECVVHTYIACYFSPVVLIMLLGVAVAAAKMLGVLPAVADPLVVGVPTVLTERLPGGGFLTGTTTLLYEMEKHCRKHVNTRNSVTFCRKAASIDNRK